MKGTIVERLLKWMFQGDCLHHHALQWSGWQFAALLTGDNISLPKLCMPGRLQCQWLLSVSFTFSSKSVNWETTCPYLQKSQTIYDIFFFLQKKKTILLNWDIQVKILKQ